MAWREEGSVKMLVTGFEPFGGEDRNPSAEILTLLPRRRAGLVISTLVLPVVFGESSRKAVAAIRELAPAAVLMLGQAGGRPDVTVERVAINLDDARIPDNRRKKPVDRSIDPAGPAAYFSTLPVRQIVDSISAAGIPASLSLSAGTFVCNHLLYSVLRRLAVEMPATMGGFIHLPWLPEQAARKQGQPSMALDLQLAAVLAALDAIGASLAPAPGGNR
jgi:pyroglutamyl-peptidase